MKVLVYGATGSQQFPVIKALKDKNVEVYATTHSQNKMQKLVEAGAVPLLADMSDANRLEVISSGMDAISFVVPFSTANAGDSLQFAENIIKAARHNAIKMIVWNTSAFVPPVKLGHPGIDFKLDIMDLLSNSTIPYIIIEPSVYAENLIIPNSNGVFKNKRVVYPVPSDMKIGWITSSDVASFIAEAIFHPELSGNSFQVSGLDNLDGQGLAEQFSTGLGIEVGYYPLLPKEFGELLQKKMQITESSAAGIVSYFESLAASTPYPPQFSPRMIETLTKLPIKMTPLSEWVKENKNAF